MGSVRINLEKDYVSLGVNLLDWSTNLDLHIEETVTKKLFNKCNLFQEIVFNEYV
jgi:hypothetical protein